MKIITKVLLIACGALLTFFFISYYLINPVLLEKYSNLEKELMNEHMDRVEYQVENALGNLARFTRDYAVWDDTFRYIETENQAYLESNYVPDTFHSNKIDFVILLNSENDILFAEQLHAEGEELLSIEEEWLGDLEQFSPFLQTNYQGIVTMEDVPYFTASHPILPSLATEASVGTMITGRLVNEEFMLQASRAVELPLQLITSVRPAVNEPYYFEAMNDRWLTGHVYIPYENSLNQAEISFQVERELYSAGKDILNVLYSVYAVSAFSALGIVLWVLNKLIFSRISHLAAEHESIEKTNDLSRRIAVSRGDEIGVLEHGLNNMLDSIENSQEDIRRLAYFDQLTGVANRRYFTEVVQNWLKTEEKVSLFFLDIDLFKQVNDQYGHDAGDMLLKSIAASLTEQADQTVFAGRWGGDEFVLAVKGGDDLSIRKLAEKITAAAARPVTIAHQSIEVTISLGISQYPEGSSTFEELIQNADKAMYEAKQSGKNQFSFSKKHKYS